MEFSNPLPPQSYSHQTSQDDSHPLTNDDFRKLMMTPRIGNSHPTAAPYQNKTLDDDSQRGGTDERKKKKQYYAKLKMLEDEKQKELDQKYRDRAKERREGKGTDEISTSVSTTADYRAVAPGVKEGANVAEKRKQIIEESKYLGGDMEHTHLVKGLDYALLEKVRAEINSKETQDEDLEEALDPAALEKKDEEDIELKGKLAKSVFRILFRTRPFEKNEMFAPGRMAYVVDLEDELPETDIPTTTIRSKADCPSAPETTTLSTNDIVINKLTQILAYLRQGRRDKKKKKDKGKQDEQTAESLKPKDDLDIFGGHDRSDKVTTKDRGKERKPDRNRREERDRRSTDNTKEALSYFEKPIVQGRDDHDESGNRKETASQFLKGLSTQYADKWNDMEVKKDKPHPQEKSEKIKRKAEIDSYAECYPGMEEAADAIGDSDEEADYTKMDMGNKKGPVNRWDFENEDDYQEYMSKREAMPKAAFQYGVKMSDGRKTRRAGPKDEKAALDREWQQIQNLIQKRKEGPSTSKKAKY